MINAKITKALNNQINAELHSAYLYLSMSAWLSSENLSGFAQWMKVQAHEEVEHAMRIYHYMIELGAKVSLVEIEGPKKSWKNTLQAFEEALSHEKLITGMINKLVELSKKEKDEATHQMLEWFVNEQVEEESNASENVAKLKMIGIKDKAALLVLDGQLGQRKEH